MEGWSSKIEDHLGTPAGPFTGPTHPPNIASRIGYRTCWSKTVSTSHPLYPPLYLFFIDSSKRFPPLYLIPLQQRPLYLVLYTSKIRIRNVFCSEFFYVRIYRTLKYHVYILFLLNSLSKT